VYTIQEILEAGLGEDFILEWIEDELQAAHTEAAA